MNDTRKKRHEQLVRSATEAFARHRIVRRGEGRWIIRGVNKDGTPASFYWAEVVCLADGSIVVVGDINLVVFGYYGDSPEPLHRLEWIGGRHHPEPDGYVVEKARHGTGREIIDQRDDDVTLADLQQRRHERVVELAEECDDPLMGDIDRLETLARMDLEELASTAYDVRARLQEHGIATPLLPGETHEAYLARLDESFRPVLKAGLEGLYREFDAARPWPDAVLGDLEHEIHPRDGTLREGIDLDRMIEMAREAEDNAVRLADVLIRLRLEGFTTLSDLEERAKAMRQEARDVLAKVLSELYTRVVAAWVAKKAGEDKECVAWDEAISQCRAGEPHERIILGLYDSGAFDDPDAFSGLGQVASARVYYAHAAVRRLWQLLVAEIPTATVVKPSEIGAEVRSPG